MKKHTKTQATQATQQPKVAPEATTAAAPETAKAEPAKPVQYFTVVAPKRPLTGTHFGVSGNAYTHTKLAEAATANGGKITWQQVMEVCAAANHRSFATYALKRLKVLTPVEVAAEQAAA